MNIKLFNISLVLATVIGLGVTGCGDDTESDGDKSINFPSNSKEAEPTIENGKEVESVVASNNIVGLPIPDGLNSANALSSTQIVAKSVKIVQKQIEDNSEYGVSYTEDISTRNCTNGGTVKTSLSANITNPKTGTYITTYAQCDNGRNTLNGEIKYSASILDYADKDLDSINVNFSTNFTMIEGSSNKSSEIKKGSNFTLQSVGDKIKINISLQATKGSTYYGQNNAIYYMYDQSNLSYIYQTEGKIYIDNLNKYVSYDRSYDMSKTPFAYNEEGTIMSGEARYIMSKNGRAKIVVEGTGNVVTYVDADGDGSFELSE